jgi:hypothetical protein
VEIVVVTRTRVFGIGLNKTATVSFHEAMTLLGYRSVHWGGPDFKRPIVRAKSEGVPLLSYVDDEWEVFSDIQVLANNFDLLDRQYPGSRFVLTTRPLEEWIDSRRRHVEKNQQRAAHGAYAGDFTDVDVPGWTREYERHHQRVRGYFATRPDALLELDITAGHGWEPLCDFLGVPVPELPFPWENKYRPFQVPDPENGS